MKITKLDRKTEFERPGFFQWVLNSGKAFRIVFIVGLIVPPFMFGIPAVLFAINKNPIWIPFAVLTIIMLVNLYTRRYLFKVQSKYTIMNYVYKDKFNKQK